ncbi:AAA family ATPase [Myxococcota bacterium]|nr:AAA family ATPase [Myxococcota bacterium]
MSTESKFEKFRSLKSLAAKLRKDLRGVRGKKKTAKSKGTNPIKGNDCVLLFAHNGVGKTRLSMEFKDIGKKGSRADTLYFNAFTEDLFDWDNDFEEDHERLIKFKSRSHFFSDLEGMGIDDQIREHLHRHADFNFKINFAEEEIRFFRDVMEDGKSKRAEDIKISRGEENLFIWCFFSAILKLATEAEKGQPYDWVKYVYIDDPISSLDEHNTITVTSDLASVIKGTKNGVKFVISTHHGLFFNVMFNELKGKRELGNNHDMRWKAYILHRPNDTLTYTLQDTSESPFLHHVAALAELKAASKSGKISQHHFNLLRSILEKTAVFFGRQHISTCFYGHPKKAIYARILNVRSHSKYSVFEAEPIHGTDKKMFREILAAFLERYQFVLPEILAKKQTGKPSPVAGPCSAAKAAPTAPATPKGKTP